MKPNHIPDYRELDWGASFLLVLGILAILVGVYTGFITLTEPIFRSTDGGGSQGLGIVVLKIILAVGQLVPGILIVITAFALRAFRDIAMNSWRTANTLAPLPALVANASLPEVEWRIRGMHKNDGEVDLVLSAISEAEARSLAFERGIQVITISRVL